MKNIITKFLIACCYIFLCLKTYGGTEPLNVRLTAANIFAGTGIAISDNKFTYPNPDAELAGWAKVNSSVGQIVLGIDQSILANPYTRFTLKVNLKITAYDKVGAIIPVPSAVTLEVKYNKDFGYQFKDKDAFVIKNCHKITALISSIVYTDANNAVFTNPSVIPSIVYMEADMVTDRIYAGGVWGQQPQLLSTQVTNLAVPSNASEIELNWPHQTGAEEYDLEYLFVNNYFDATTLIAATALNYDFRNNATRITTAQNFYRLSLVFEKGYLLYRVRVRGRDLNDPSAVLYGNWNTCSTAPCDSGVVSNYVNKYQVTSPHDDAKNWQYSASFAEEGKKKEVVSYYDGSLRSRQSVTKVNTTNNIVVGETFYDYQGRPAINVLPVPISALDIKYRTNFNLTMAGAPYNKSVFDVDASSSGCTMPNTPGMLNTSSGASNYYSINNLDKEEQQAYVPDAKNYPFTQIEYTPDNTGRIRRQGGVGNSHQLNSGHETKYYYSQPEQAELDRLFGSEAGLSSHYKKNTAVDANKQISSSLIDMYGHTVATYLTGNVPANVDALPATAQQITSTYIKPNIIPNPNREIGENVLVFTKELVVTTPGPYVFNYSLEREHLTSICAQNASPMCYNCVYKLSVDILDECGVSLLGASPFTHVIGTIDSTAFACPGTNPIFPASAGVSPFTINIANIGSYSIVKKLTADEAVANLYASNYIRKDKCIKKLTDFDVAAMAEIDLTGCHTDCSDCLGQLGAYSAHNDLAKGTPGDPSYDANYVYMTQADYDETKAECEEACKAVTECDVLYQLMLGDVSPSGQYAQYNTLANGSLDASAFALSLLNPANVLPQSYEYSFGTAGGCTPINGVTPATVRYPKMTINSVIVNEYRDEDGLTRSKIYLDQVGTNYVPDYDHTILTSGPYFDAGANKYYVYPEQLLDLKDFVSAFGQNPQWSRALIEYHPEWGYYGLCTKLTDPTYANKNGKTSEEFDQALRDADTFVKAAAAGFIDSTNTMNLASPLDLFNQDPFFDNMLNGNIPLGHNQNFNAKTEFLNNVVNNYKNSGKNLKEIATQLVRCNNVYYGVTSGCTGAGFGDFTYFVGTPEDGQNVRDAEWRAYRDFYVNEKQKLSKNVMNKIAKGSFNQGSSPYGVNDDGFFNGPIGIGDEYYNQYANDMVVLGQFWSFWWWGWSPFVSPTFPILINQLTDPRCKGYGAFDPAQPSNFNTWPYYTNKTKRFITGDKALPPSISVNAMTHTNINALSTYADFNTYQVTGQCPVTMNFEAFLNQLLDDFTFTTTSPYPVVLNDYFTKGMYDVLDPLGSGNNTYKLFSYLPATTANGLTGTFLDATNTPANCGFSLIYTGGGTTFNWLNLKYFSDINFIDEAPSGTYNFVMKGYYDDDANPLTANIEGTFSGSTCFKLGGCSFVNYCSPSQAASELLGLLNVLQTTQSGSSALASTSAINLSTSPYTSLLTPKLKKPYGSASTMYWTATTVPGSHLIATLSRTSPPAISSLFDFDFAQIIGGGYTYSSIQFFSSIVPDASNPNKFTLQAYVGIVNGVPKFIPVEVIITPPATAPLYKLGNCGAPPNVNCQSPQNQSLEDMQKMLNDLVSPTYNLISGTAVDLQPLDGFSTLLQSYLAPGNSKTWNYNGVSGFYNNFTISASIGTGLTACNLEFKMRKYHPTIAPVPITSFSAIKADNSQLSTGGYPSDFYIIAHYATASDTALIHVKTSCFQFQNCIECDVAQPFFYSETFDTYIGGASPQNSIISPDFGSAVSGNNCALSAPNTYNLLNETIQPATCAYGGQAGFMLDNKDHSGFFNKNYMHFRVDLAANATLDLWQFSNGSNNLVTVAPNSNYEFSCWYRKSFNEPMILGLFVNGVRISEDEWNGYDSGTWRELKFNWNSGANTTADIRVKITNTTGGQQATFYTDLDQVVFRTKPCMAIHASNPQPTDSLVVWEPCDTMLTAIGNANALVAYERYIAKEKTDFKKNYLSKCLSAFETFGVQYTDLQHHYTLYYYDQAGNLIKTIPPAGVEPLVLTNNFPNTAMTYSQAIESDRLNNTRNVLTNHRMATTYEYNSLNQLINQSVPDHDTGGSLNLTNTVNGAVPTLPAGVVVNSMDFKGQTGFLVGTDGTYNAMNGVIYSTTDGGATWAPASNVSFNNLNKVQDAGNSTLYAVCDAGALVKSTNNGTSWTQLTISGAIAKINDLHFFTDLSGIVVGNNGTIYKTTNGGTSWTQQTGVVSTAVHINDIQFTDANHGYIAGTNGTLFYTTNGGSNWIAPTIPLNSNLSISSVNFYAPQIINTYEVITGFLTGYDNVTNQGRTVYITNLKSSPYTAQSTNPLNFISYAGIIFNSGLTQAKQLNSIAVSDPLSTGTTYTDDEIITAGKNGEIYKITYNATTTMWQGALQAVPTSYSGEISQVAFTQYNGTTVPFATVKNGDLLKQAGTSWTPLSGFTNATPLNGLYFSQPYSTGSAVYAVGNGGQIYKSSNGGTSFANLTQLSFPKLNDVSIAKDNSGIVLAVGDGGSVIRSTNNGSTWTSITPIVTNDFSSVWAFSNTNAVIAGIYGVMTTLNNGVLSSPTYPTGSSINDVYFMSPTTGYFVGDNGILFTSTNAGTSWSSVTSGTSNDLKSIHSYGTTVLAVGNSGTVIRSTGGAFTNIVQSASSAQLRNVRVVDNLLAYAFGPSSTIIKTQDGGLTWSLSNAQYGYDFNAVVFTNQGTALIGGWGPTTLFQMTDDPGKFTSSFWYDRLGRLVISQNVKQAKRMPTPAYSYTKYDALGRVTEVGEMTNTIKPCSLTNYNNIINDVNYTAWASAGARAEVTTSKYDQVTNSNISQRNLRKRVSATYVDDNGNLNDGYKAATFYSYDIHGNVSTMLEDNPGLVSVGMNQRYKKINYDYDLISRKMNEVKYQDKQPDAFYHKYYYDADNRITNVYTSRNGLSWEQDAKYFYYKHGPLARVETGDEKIQGTDYAYTIHGWTKGVNSSTMKQLRDIGKDGEQTLTTSGPLVYNTTHPSLNKYISQDAYGYNLNFYNGDYTAIAGIAPTAKYGLLNSFDAAFTTATNDQLFNGNISSMATAIPWYTGGVITLNANPVLMSYKYDQLNRVKNAGSYYNMVSVTTNNTWASISSGNHWKNSFTYDPNGNIETQNRYDATGVQIDQMVYKYDLDGNSKPRKNRLYHVNDNTSLSVNAADDIDDQGTFVPAGSGNVNTANNYGYDEIGNLVRDNQEQIGTIEWTVYGKIKKITRSSGTKPDMEYVYDAGGNRITKIVKPRPSGSPSAPSSWVYTHYRRDAQGNVMATYEEDKANTTYKVKEFSLFGSSRLGELSGDNYTNLVNINASQYKLNHEKGFKSYQLCNHIDNVIAVVSDRRRAIDDNANNITDLFEAEVLSFTDYSPFGAPMPGRQFNNGSYRYGFNGKEKDDEIVGSGNMLDFGAREYDTRIGRWWSTDPLQQFVGSQYSAFANNPILHTDQDGRWIPGVDDNGRIFVTAEKGDNLKSLYKFFGGKENANKYLSTQWVGKAAPKFVISTGTTIKLNTTNVFSQATGDAADPNKKAKYTQQNNEGDADRNYNCHTAAVCGSKGESFQDKSNMDIDDRNKIIKDGYENATSGEAVFGETIVTFGDQHSAVYFGTSQDGTDYVFSKNGTATGPTIEKSVNLTGGNQDATLGAPTYGAVGNPTNDGGSAYESYGKNVDKKGRQVGADGKGIKQSNGTGYYNPKKK